MPKPFWTGPVPAQNTPEWLAWLDAWVASHPKREGSTTLDDSRESIYGLEMPDGPPPGETADEWIARLTAGAESHPKRDIVIDDSRESIYDRDTP